MMKFDFVVSNLTKQDVDFLWGAIVAYVEGVGGDLTGLPRKLTEDELKEYQSEFETEGE